MMEVVKYSGYSPKYLYPFVCPPDIPCSSHGALVISVIINTKELCLPVFSYFFGVRCSPCEAFENFSFLFHCLLNKYSIANENKAGCHMEID